MCSREDTQDIVDRSQVKSHTAITKMLNDFAFELHARIDQLETRENDTQRLVQEIRDYLHRIANKL